MKPTIAAPTARGIGNFAGARNIVTDALYEIGYDDTLVDILIQRNVLDFTAAHETNHIIDQLSELYGEAVLSGDLEDIVACEGLDISLTGELAKRWHAAKGDTFRERVRYLISAPIETLKMKVISLHELENSSPLSEELESIKRQLMIDYGQFDARLPNIDLVIYTSEGSRVVAVISCPVKLKDRVIEDAYWRGKLHEDTNKTAIKFYLITPDIDLTLRGENVRKKRRPIAETEFDGTYVLKVGELIETDKVKRFEHFIGDLEQVISESQ